MAEIDNRDARWLWLQLLGLAKAPVGRIDMKADRAKGVLVVKQVWWEAGIRASVARIPKLESEVGRMARFVGMKDIQWDCAAPGAGP